MLKEIPDYDRPREKALKYGINTLSNIELLAIILRTGSKEENVIDVAAGNYHTLILKKL